MPMALCSKQCTYTQSQKNRNIFEVAFLLEKSVYPWIWGYTFRFLMTPSQMTLTLDPRKNPRRKVAFLLRLSVVFSQNNTIVFPLILPGILYLDRPIQESPAVESHQQRRTWQNGSSSIWMKAHWLLRGRNYYPPGYWLTLTTPICYLVEEAHISQGFLCLWWTLHMAWDGEVACTEVGDEVKLY